MIGCRKITISLRAKEFSYYSDIEGQEHGDSHVVFSLETFHSIMGKIA